MYQSRPLVLLIALLAACGGEPSAVEEPPCESRGNCAPQALLLPPDTVHLVEGRHVASASSDSGRSPLAARPGPSVVWAAAVTQGDSVTLYHAWAAKPPFNFTCWHAGASCDLGGGGGGTFTLQPLSVNGVSAGAIFSTGSPGDVKVRVKIAP